MNYNTRSITKHWTHTIKKEKEYNASVKVQRNPEQVFSLIDDEVVMLNLEQGEYYALNETASRIWKLIEKPVELHVLFGLLVEIYDVSIDLCKKDTVECLNDFSENGLILYHD